MAAAGTLAVSAQVVPVAGRDFYVSPAGTPTGDGTPRKPWNSQASLQNAAFGSGAASITNYGATPNDGTDDTQAIAAALAANRHIYIPPGTFDVSAVSPPSNTTISGAGSVSLLRRLNTRNSTLIFARSVSNVTVENFAIDMNGSADFSTAVGFRRNSAAGTNSTDIRIRDLSIYDTAATGMERDGRMGILTIECERVWIERNHLKDNFRIKAGGLGDQVTVADNIIDGANDNALTIAITRTDSNTSRYLITGNRITAPYGAGIYVGDDGRNMGGVACESIIVDRNIITGPFQKGQVGIIVRLPSSSKRLHITNNIIYNPGPVAQWTIGIYTSDQTEYGAPGDDYLIALNTVEGPFNSGAIWLRKLNRVRVIGNQVTNFGSRGVRLHDVSNAVVSNNIASGGNRGFEVEDSTDVALNNNTATGLIQDGFVLSSTVGKSTSVTLTNNRSKNNGGYGMVQYGVGAFDTIYLMNEVRGNAQGNWSGVRARAVCLGPFCP